MGKGIILIAVENKGNRDVLQTYLQQYYDIEVHLSESPFEKHFDLGIFDGVGLSRLRDQIEIYRAATPNLFLPMLLITSRQDIGVLTNNLWQTIDEIIFSPIEKMELVARVEMLLRTRRYSVALNDLMSTVKEGAALAERQRLARELHDSVSQTLFLSSTLAQAVPFTEKTDPLRAAKQIEEVGQLNRAALTEMRLLLLELRPDNIARSTFKELIDQIILAAQGRRSIAITSQIEVATQLPDHIHLALYRLVQEAVNNIVKHSDASQAHIKLAEIDGQVQLNIEDNGKGFDTTEQTNGLGLLGMRERAAQIGATFTVSSGHNGEGTQITISLPTPIHIASTR